MTPLRFVTGRATPGDGLLATQLGSLVLTAFLDPDYGRDRTFSLGVIVP